MINEKNSQRKDEQIVLDVSGMTCPACAKHVSSALKSIEGIISVETNKWQEGIILFRAAKDLSEEEVTDAVAKAGYQATIKRRGEQLTKPSFKLRGSSEYFDYDLAVIGTGGAGMAAAITGAELGFRVAIIEEGVVGGTCVNIGCVPSKTLIKMAALFHSISHHPFHGISAEKVSLSWPLVVEQKEQLVKQLRKSKYEEILSTYENITLFKGRAVFLEEHKLQVVDKQQRQQHQVFTANKTIIASGAHPRILPVKGVDEVEILTSTTVMALQKRPESMLVIGGRAIALELGQVFERFGTKVTILQRSATILPEHEPEIARQLTQFLEEEGIKIITNVQLMEIRLNKRTNQKEILAKVKGKKRLFRAEEILMATGREPNTANMGLESLGLRLDRQGFIETNERLETNLPGIFAAGDVTQNPKFIYVAATAGKIAAENALQKGTSVLNLSVLPRVIFTEPQVATVGLTEHEAMAQQLPIETTTLPMEYVPYALAAHNTKGFIKLIREKDSRQLLGAHILADRASELIGFASLLIAFSKKYAIPTEAITEEFFPYLTQVEGLKLALLTFSKDITKLSCCAT